MILLWQDYYYIRQESIKTEIKQKVELSSRESLIALNILFQISDIKSARNRFHVNLDFWIEILLSISSRSVHQWPYFIHNNNKQLSGTGGTRNPKRIRARKSVAETRNIIRDAFRNIPVTRVSCNISFPSRERARNTHFYFSPQNHHPRGTRWTFHK